MSVIAWDGVLLAADSQLTAGGQISCGRKMRRGKNGVLLAWVGSQSEGQRMARWYDAGARPGEFPECACGGQSDESTELIVILADGSAWTFEHTSEPVRVHERKYAWGSGAAYALGALSAGADAKRAAAIACQWDSQCGRGVRTLALKA